MSRKHFLGILLFLLTTWVVQAQETERQYLSGTGLGNTVTWQFRVSEGRNSGRWSKIEVPSQWELQGFGEYTYGRWYKKPGVKNPSMEEGTYKRSFRVPRNWQGQNIRLWFDGVMTDTEVLVNGQSAGPVHQGGFYRFSYDVTELLKYGSSNQIEVRVKKHSDNRTVNAAERKAPAELFIRKFARVYTPIVIILAVLIVLSPLVYSLINPAFVFTFNDWLYRALVFLVISCPCALVVSIPLGYFGGIGAASRLGILFKGGNYLDAITRINTVVFDKTGTLTKGTFDVQACKSAGDISEEELVKLIASVESDSTHPIAKAVVNYAKERNIERVTVADTKEYAGFGLEATVDGIPVLVGNCRLLSKFDISFPQELLKMTDTIVVCAAGNRYAGYLLLADALKEDAKVAIDRLKALNIENIQILSGDKQSIVTNFAEKLGISKAYGDLLPEGKVKHLEELRQDEANQIAFVGDGMNDAPVLALSHVGIAMGGLGSDAAIETADVVIQTDQPSKVAEAIKVGKLTRRIIWQNVSLAFGVKLLVLILGAGGIATLWEAVFADVGVALLAIMNAVRIQKMIK